MRLFGMGLLNDIIIDIGHGYFRQYFVFVCSVRSLE